MDHHPNRTRAARHADGPDYTTAHLAGRANGATDGDMDAYLEAAERAHADAADAQAGDAAVPAKARGEAGGALQE